MGNNAEKIYAQYLQNKQYMIQLICYFYADIVDLQDLLHTMEYRNVNGETDI